MSRLKLSDAAVTALRDALGAEYAAAWVYDLTTAFVSEDRVRSAVREAVASHRGRRDAARRLLRDAGVEPPPPDAAYRVPRQVTDQDSAIRLLITTEEDCAVGWRAVLEAGDSQRVRRSALDGLTTAATRATRWRITVGEQPPTPAFPGVP